MSAELIESTERAPGLPRAIDSDRCERECDARSETRFPGLPVSAPEKTPCTRMLDDVVPKSVTDATLACIASTAKYGTPESLRIQVESAVRWACIDAYYAGKADERREFGEGYLQGLADIERAIRGGVKS